MDLWRLTTLLEHPPKSGKLNLIACSLAADLFRDHLDSMSDMDLELMEREILGEVNHG